MIKYKNTEAYQKLIDLGFEETTGPIQLKRGVVELKVPYNLRRKKDDNSYSDSYVIFPDGKIRHIGRDNSAVTSTEAKKEAKVRKTEDGSYEKMFGDSTETRNISTVRKIKVLKTEDDYDDAFSQVLDLILKRKLDENKIYNFTEFMNISESTVTNTPKLENLSVARSVAKKFHIKGSVTCFSNLSIDVVLKIINKFNLRSDLISKEITFSDLLNTEEEMILSNQYDFNYSTENSIFIFNKKLKWTIIFTEQFDDKIMNIIKL